MAFRNGERQFGRCEKLRVCCIYQIGEPDISIRDLSGHPVGSQGDHADAELGLPEGQRRGGAKNRARHVLHRKESNPRGRSSPDGSFSATGTCELAFTPRTL